MVVVFAVLHGLAWGVRGPLMAARRADYFGSASSSSCSPAAPSRHIARRRECPGPPCRHRPGRRLS